MKVEVTVPDEFQVSFFNFVVFCILFFNLIFPQIGSYNILTYYYDYYYYYMMLYIILLQGNAVGGLNKRKGVILNTDTSDGYCVIDAEVPLNNMFGYSTELRSATQVCHEERVVYWRYIAKINEFNK